MLIRISDNKYPATMDDLGADYPNMAIPPTISDADLRPLGYARVVQVAAPAIDPAAQIVTEGIPTLVAGSYQRTWGVADLPAEEIAAQITGKKTLLTSHVEQQRDVRRYANVTAHGRTWQADQNSKGLLADDINLAQAGLPLPALWRDATNNDMAIATINDLLAIAGAMAAQTQAAYAWSWVKKAEIAAATTLSELAAIDINQ